MTRHVFRPLADCVEIYIVLSGGVLSCPLTRRVSLVEGCTPGEGVFEVPGYDNRYFCVGSGFHHLFTDDEKKRIALLAVKDALGRPCFVFDAPTKGADLGKREIRQPELFSENKNSYFIEEEF